MTQVELRLAGGPAVLALGFRPFFLLAAWYGAAILARWVAFYQGWWTVASPLPPVVWHAHEMLFGFAMAAVAGFLLTAVPNWTGLPTPRGPALGALVTLWLLGRAALLGDWLPYGAAAGLDLAFLPCLGLALAKPLVGARQARNFVFLPILAAMFLANLLVWTEHAPLGLELQLLCLLQLVVLIGGRVIPFFIRAALPGAVPVSWGWVEALVLGSLPCLLVAEKLGLTPFWLGWLYLAAGSAHAARLAGWYDSRLWGVPLLWILFLGYGWMPVGLVLKAQAWGLGLDPRAALHAFTAGCVGSLILGMMARVGLGHSGRPLAPHRLIVASFTLVTVAASLRALGPLLVPSAYMELVAASGLLWSLSFAVYGVIYWPILSRPRLDGRPG